MANSANPEINKKIATSALGTLFIATVFFYLGDRYAETLVTYPGQIFDHLGDAMLTMWETIGDAPFALDMTSNSLLFGGACFLIIWMIWLRYVAFIGNYRSGEESGSARWGTVKEGKKFKDLQTEDNNLLFTKNFGLALHRPKFDPEYDRNLNVLVVGGSGSGKTFNYVTPNICQLNTSYFVTDPKGTLLKDAGYLFTDNGYKLKSFIETQGRIHTSTATVAVMPQAEEVDLVIDPKDLRIDTFRSSGAGGQHINKTSSAIRVTHIPTGMVVECQNERSQFQNKDKALEILRSRLLAQKQKEQQDAINANRAGQVGTGDRSEKIRTYNFPQDRCTDHRIGLTVHNLDKIMDGNLDEIIDALATHEQAEKLRQLNAQTE